MNLVRTNRQKFKKNSLLRHSIKQ